MSRVKIDLRIRMFCEGHQTINNAFCLSVCLSRRDRDDREETRNRRSGGEGRLQTTFVQVAPTIPRYAPVRDVAGVDRRRDADILLIRCELGRHDGAR